MMVASALPETVTLIGEGLTAAAETVSTDEAERIVSTHYGLRTKARALAGEKDSNFHLTVGDGAEYLFKIVHSADDQAISDMHTQALLHVARRDPDLPTQHVVPTTDGLPQFLVVGHGRQERVARLVTFARGKLQSRSPKSGEQRRNLGRALARLQIALSDFQHRGGDHESAWDVKHAASLLPVVREIGDALTRRLLENVLDRFATIVAPTLPSLRSQVVHNDFSGDNVLVDPTRPDEVTGILDFGDMVRTAVAIDVAVGAAYHLSADGEPLNGALDFLEGFASVRRLEPAEVELMFDLILSRMLVRLAITEWRARNFPENREYILRNTPLARAQLERLLAINPASATDAIRRAASPRPE